MTTLQTKIEPIYVVDTNALVWYLTAVKKLGKRASAVFEAAERGETRLHISAISIMELYYANRKWEWFPNFAQTYAAMKSKPYFEFVLLIADDVLDFDQDETVPEMHDRIITGLARRLGAPLITADPLIIRANVVMTIW